MNESTVFVFVFLLFFSLLGHVLLFCCFFCFFVSFALCEDRVELEWDGMEEGEGMGVEKEHGKEM